MQSDGAHSPLTLRSAVIVRHWNKLCERVVSARWCDGGMKMRTSLTKSLVVAVALATTLSLSGCFGNPLDQIGDKINEGIAEGAAEKLIEGATGGDLNLETDGSMPDGFPSEVPVLDGKVQSSMGMTVEGTKMWMVSFVVDDAKSAVNLAREKLLAAGFEESVWTDSPMVMGRYVNDVYGVMIVAVTDEDEEVVTYQVLEDQAGK